MTRSVCGAAGVIDLPTVQKYINLHYSVSVDLFGQELSTNAANYFTAGLKGRYLESRIDDDHRLSENLWPVHTVRDGQIAVEQMAALGAVNERLRDDYIKDCQRGLERWNRALETLGRGLPAGAAPPVLQPAHRERGGPACISRRSGDQRGRSGRPTSPAGCPPTRIWPTWTR